MIEIGPELRKCIGDVLGFIMMMATLAFFYLIIKTI